MEEAFNNGLDQIKRDLGVQTDQELFLLINNPHINHPLIVQLREMMKYMKVVESNGI
ncbi:MULTISPECIES: hypothetical protein [Aerococcus]|uniref:Uncharacterized protein n=1 Tax=Aerococcus mictus TaxID=2976810 RepID=A0A9Q4DB08_9LACT|nr:MULTISPECIES: hypothetical protein [Aerococcus]MBU5610969.1 hypothetical protein [Aerococcus urinae]MCY3034036.1 hypothetical protein [Aerococcus mictus]MCY3065804.1 hypothetical protein [Aerococcus mictus]MCY3066440.1 hypothetical protein [Aerococcus mictus]MCY3071365.1 hypothetical protein [Aerococcus mictus]